MAAKRPSVALLTTVGSVIVAGAAWYCSTAPTPPTLSSTFPLKTKSQIITVTRLNPLQIEEKLSAKAFSVQNNPSARIIRWDVSQVNSNEPVEDYHSEFAVLEKFHAGGNASFNGKMFWGVFDGHGGWQCSQKVAQELPLYCATAISQAEKSLAQVDIAEKKDIANLLRSQVVGQALTSAFLKLDNDIVHGSLAAMAATPHKATKLLRPALAGSCALLAHIDIARKDLYVAWVGDSRAVLGTISPDTGEITAVPLSRDQTGKDPDEIARIRAEHPGEEETAVWRGRVLGSLEPSRSFGDSRYKWDIKTHEFIVKRIFNREMPRGYLTPPYVNANPGITHHKIQPEDKFLVLATDGLYDELGNDEIANLVADWMRQRNLLPKSTAPKSTNSSKHRPWSNRDENVATHLIRNALGGSDEEGLSKILSIPAPHSRRHRDDITVTVVFFGEGDDSSDVTVPHEVPTIVLDVGGEKGGKPMSKL